MPQFDPVKSQMVPGYSSGLTPASNETGAMDSGYSFASRPANPVNFMEHLTASGLTNQNRYNQMTTNQLSDAGEPTEQQGVAPLDTEGEGEPAPTPAPGEEGVGQPPTGPTYEGPPDVGDVFNIFGKYEGQTLTPELMQQMATDLMSINLGIEVGNQQYKLAFLDYLGQQLDLNSQQLDHAQQQLEFQQGPYWDWYTGEYFDFVKLQNQNAMEMSNNEVERSKIYNEQARAQTLGAYYQAQIPQYQLAIEMARNPRGVAQIGRAQAPGNMMPGYRG